MKRLAVLLIVSLPMLANAGVITVSDSFSATYSTGPISSFSGSFSLTFDDSVVNPLGSQIYSVALDSLTLAPATIGVNTYNLTNSGAWLVYSSGVLSTMYIGGTIDGFPSNMKADGDWRLIYFTSSLTSGIAGQIDLTAGGQFYVGSNKTGSLSIGAPTNVPEPGTIALLGMGIAGIGLVRRRKVN